MTRLKKKAELLIMAAAFSLRSSRCRSRLAERSKLAEIQLIKMMTEVVV